MSPEIPVRCSAHGRTDNCSRHSHGRLIPVGWAYPDRAAPEAARGGDDGAAADDKQKKIGMEGGEKKCLVETEQVRRAWAR